MSEPLEPAEEYPELILRPHQEEHYGRVQEILARFYFYMDGSKQGTGKSFIAGRLSLDLNLPLVVICPLSVRNVWLTLTTTYGIPVYDIPETTGIMTYETLSSEKNRQPRHGLLIRDDTASKPIYYATPTWQGLVQQGVLLIVDECQKVKNDNTRNRAVAGLVQTIYAGGRSRAAFLSGTPIDKPSQVVNFLRMVGFIQSGTLYARNQASGVQEALAWANRINPQATHEFLRTIAMEPSHDGAVEYIYQLFVQIIRKGVMSIMPNPLDQRKDIKNGFYYLDPESAQTYREGIVELIKASNYQSSAEEGAGEMTPEEIEELMRTTEQGLPALGATLATQALAEGTVSMTNMGKITKALVKIQQAKAKAVIRVAREILTTPRTNDQGEPVYPKVVIFASYYVVIDEILVGLREFNPVELTGRTPEQTRVRNINAFIEPSNRVRVFVGNPIAGGLGISIPDYTGYYPSFMFILPDYRINELVQASDRTTRPGMVGQSYVRFFYGLSGLVETAIIGALARKGKVMREVTFEQTYTGALFPDQFENEIEAQPQIAFAPTHLESAIGRLHIS